METRKYILEGGMVEKKLKRMALEVIENNWEEEEIILLGIVGPGEVVMQCIKSYMESLSKIIISCGVIDLNKRSPNLVNINLDKNFNDKVVLIVDDVLDSGRTLLYALKPLLNYHPKKIQTLVLVSRHHHLFPIQPDYIGLKISTTVEEKIWVEADGQKVKSAYLV